MSAKRCLTKARSAMSAPALWLKDIVCSGSRIETLLIAVACVVLAGWLALVLFHKFTSHDLGYIWLAGHVWRAGLDPYGDNYAILGERLLGPYGHPAPFFYPPNWWPFATMLSMITFASAAKLWALACLAQIVLAHMAIRLICPPARSGYAVLALALCYSLTSTGVRSTIGLGQTSILIMAAYALTMFGINRRSIALTAIGAALVMLKPNMGMVLLAPLLLDRRALLGLTGGAILSIICVAPALLDTPLPDLLRGFIANMARYDDFYVNSAVAQTGLGNLLFHLTGIDVPPIFLSVAGAVCALLTCWALTKRERCSRRRVNAMLLAGSICTVFFVRFHIHDMVVIGLLVQPLLLLTLPNVGRFACAAGMLLILRVEDLARIVAWELPGTHVVASNSPLADMLASTATALMFAGLIALVVETKRTLVTAA